MVKVWLHIYRSNLDALRQGPQWRKLEEALESAYPNSESWRKRNLRSRNEKGPTPITEAFFSSQGQTQLELPSFHQPACQAYELLLAICRWQWSCPQRETKPCKWLSWGQTTQGRVLLNWMLHVISVHEDLKSLIWSSIMLMNSPNPCAFLQTQSKFFSLVRSLTNICT